MPQFLMFLWKKIRSIVLSLFSFRKKTILKQPKARKDFCLRIKIKNWVWNWYTTRPVLDRFHDSSIPLRKCAKSSETVPKPEKVWIIAIFAVQMLFFWCAEQKILNRAVQMFAALWRKFCRSTNFCSLMAKY